MDFESIEELNQEDLERLYNDIILEPEKMSAHCSCYNGTRDDMVYGYGDYYYCGNPYYSFGCRGRWTGYAYGP